MDDSTLLATVREFATELHAELCGHANIPEDTEVVVHINNDGDKQYYLASPMHSSVFWLEEVDTVLITSGARPLRDLTYISQSHKPCS